MTDEQRCDSLGCYGSPWARTPNLDRLAREGVVFDNAVTPAPVCVPARASILSGQYPHRTGVWYNAGKDAPADGYLTSVFHQAGYRSASFGKQHYTGPRDVFQTEKDLVLHPAVHYFHYAPEYDPKDYGVVQYPPEPYPWIFGGRFPHPGSEKTEAQAVAHAISWLDHHDTADPFLLRVSFNGPHTPVAPPEPFHDCIDPTAIRIPPETEAAPDDDAQWAGESLRALTDSSRMTREEIDAMRRYYYGEVSFLDSQFGRLLDYMRDHGHLENTIVVFMSDHGTHLGDFGMVQKQTFYEPSVNVPYFWWYPQAIASDTTLNTPVELRNTLPTLLDMVGLEIPEHCKADSYVSALRQGSEPPAKPVFSEFTLGSFRIREKDRLVMVRDGDWKLSLCMDPEPGDGMLFNMADDPHERRNLYTDPAHTDERARLTQLILEHLNA
jgi:arylsulfatase A-like enzyme